MDGSAVALPTFTDGSHVAVGLFSAQVTVTHHGVVIILRLAQAEDERSHVVPQVRVFAVLACQGHGVADVSRASIIGRQDKVYTFRPAGYIAEFTFEFTEVPGCRTDVLFGLVHLVGGQAEMYGCLRHDLHQSACSGPRYGFRVETGLLVTLCGHEPPVPPDGLAMTDKMSVVRRDNALGAILEGGTDTAFYTSAGRQAQLFPFLQERPRLGFIPSVQGFGQEGCILSYDPSGFGCGRAV